MNDTTECLELLRDQQSLLQEVLVLAQSNLNESENLLELGRFILSHGWHINEVSKAVILTIEQALPYTVPILARSALESAFNLAAALKLKEFGAQKMAHEHEQLARYLRLFRKNGSWGKTWKPTPDDCEEAASKLVKKYGVKGKEWRHVEQIAMAADLEPLYDDYRFLCFSCHANQAGIVNSASGFLVRKGALSVSNAAFVAGGKIAAVFGGRQFHNRLEASRERIDESP